MGNKPIIALLGGTGDLGLGMANILAAAGYRVVIGSRSAELPIRMTEVNSVYGGGKPGVSDTLAAAVKSRRKKGKR